MSAGQTPTARHALVIHRSANRLRERSAAWVADALARGEKVLYRSASGPAELGAAGVAAMGSGQLEVIDAWRCHEETGGRHVPLYELHLELVTQAHRDGYPGVAVTADQHALRTMVPDANQRLRHEHDLEALAAEPGVRVLCLYDVYREQPDVLNAVVGVHHRHIDDVLWSIRRSGERLWVRGELDANNADRFAAALSTAAANGARTVDLAELTVLSATAIRAFEQTTEVLHRLGTRLRLVDVSPSVLRTLELVRFTEQNGVQLVLESPMPASETDGRLVPVADDLNRVTRFLLRGGSVGDVLTRIAAAALELVAGADLASVTMRGQDGHVHTLVRSEPLADTLDQLQYALGEGPCLDAARPTGPAMALSQDLATDPVWPRFGPGAATLGIGSVLSTALLPDASPSARLTGALNLYSRRPGGMTDTDRDIALILAGHASLTLATTYACTPEDLWTTHPGRQIASDDVLIQVKGILMRRRGIDADAAVDLLRRVSRRLSGTLGERGAQ